METPNVIYLIDTGDEISWCDDQNPSGDIDIDDTIKYVKSSISDALLEALEEIYQMVQESYHVDDSNMETMDKVYAAIAAARGE